MKTFKHIGYTGKRDYEVTNVCFAKAHQSPGVAWVLCDVSEIPASMTALWREGGVQYWGWL